MSVNVMKDTLPKAKKYLIKLVKPVIFGAMLVNK